MERIIGLEPGSRISIQDLLLQNLNGQKEYGCSPTPNNRLEFTAFKKTALASRTDNAKELYMRINSKMRLLDEDSRKGVLEYSSLFDTQGNDKSSADDIAKLTCGEIASIPYG